MDVQELTGDDAAAAGPVLARAFAEDPLFGWLLRGPGRVERLGTAFTAFAAAATRTPGSRVLITTERTAAALWLPPGALAGGLRERLRSAPPLVRSLRGGVLRGLRVDAVLAQARPAAPHWYLEALGAVPEARGTGAGGRLLRPVLERCDAQGLPAYLESSNPRNWSFYARHGFVRSAPLPLPPGCPLVVPMLRPPGATG